MQERRKRLVYLMLFRVGLVTLLLVATFVSELAGPSSQPVSARTDALLALIAATYGLTIVFALWLERMSQGDEAASRMALLQVATDLLLTTALVHLTGGIDSGFVFMYLLVIVWSSFVLGTSAIGAAVAAVAFYAGLATLRRTGILPTFGAAAPLLPLREVLRTVGVNAVAFAGTGVLAARLQIELKRAGERLESQGVRLRDLATLYQDVIRSLTSGLLTLARDGVVIACNGAARELLGLSEERIEGRPIGEVMPALAPLLGAVAEESPLKRGELVHRRGDGERILGVSLSPLFDSHGAVRGRIVSFQDLTELRRMEQAVARSERLAAIGRLAAGIAHEIRNPLAAISGAIELLGQNAGPAPSSETGELQAIVLREVDRLNLLISGLLDFARPRPPEPARLDLAATLGEMIQVFQHDRQLAGARVELRASGPVWVNADANQLRQVVWNLLRNAAQASPPDAPIVVAVDPAEGGGRLSVRDHGPGIPPEHRARLFEPFFTTKQGGTGLGLATVHRIVEDHHGRIELDTPQDGGALISIFLPAA